MILFSATTWRADEDKFNKKLFHCIIKCVGSILSPADHVRVSLGKMLNLQLVATWYLVISRSMRRGPLSTLNVEKHYISESPFPGELCYIVIPWIFWLKNVRGHLLRHVGAVLYCIFFNAEFVSFNNGMIDCIFTLIWRMLKCYFKYCLYST